MDLNNIVGFKAVDKNGNERQVTVDEMTELVSARIVSAASEISTFAAAAAAGTDEFEDQLPQSDTFSWLRTLDGSKNPTLTSSSAAAKVLGELLPTNGIKRTEYYETIRVGASFSIGAPTNEFVYVSHNDGEMMVYIDSTGIVTKIFSSADEIISISLKDNQIMITAIHYDLIVTISVLSF